MRWLADMEFCPGYYPAIGITKVTFSRESETTNEPKIPKGVSCALLTLPFHGTSERP